MFNFSYINNAHSLTFNFEFINFYKNNNNIFKI